MSKALATIVTQPLIVAKVGLQSKPPPARQGKPFKSFVEVMQFIVENEGPLSLFKGMGPQILKGLLVQGILMMTKERCVSHYLLTGVVERGTDFVITAVSSSCSSSSSATSRSCARGGSGAAPTWPRPPSLLPPWRSNKFPRLSLSHSLSYSRDLVVVRGRRFLPEFGGRRLREVSLYKAWSGWWCEEEAVIRAGRGTDSLYMNSAYRFLRLGHNEDSFVASLHLRAN